MASALIPVPVREIAPSEEEALMPMPKDVENLADDPNLQNPLQRSERMSTSWFGVSAALYLSFFPATRPLQASSHLQKLEEYLL